MCVCVCVRPALAMAMRICRCGVHTTSSQWEWCGNEGCFLGDDAFTRVIGSVQRLRVQALQVAAELARQPVLTRTPELVEMRNKLAQANLALGNVTKARDAQREQHERELEARREQHERELAETRRELEAQHEQHERELAETRREQHEQHEQHERELAEAVCTAVSEARLADERTHKIALGAACDAVRAEAANVHKQSLDAHSDALAEAEQELKTALAQSCSLHTDNQRAKANATQQGIDHRKAMAAMKVSHQAEISSIRATADEVRVELASVNAVVRDAKAKIAKLACSVEELTSESDRASASMVTITRAYEFVTGLPSHDTPDHCTLDHMAQGFVQAAHSIASSVTTSLYRMADACDGSAIMVGLPSTFTKHSYVVDAFSLPNDFMDVFARQPAVTRCKMIDGVLRDVLMPRFTALMHSLCRMNKDHVRIAHRVLTSLDDNDTGAAKGLLRGALHASHSSIHRVMGETLSALPRTRVVEGRGADCGEHGVNKKD